MDDAALQRRLDAIERRQRIVLRLVAFAYVVGGLRQSGRTARFSHSSRNARQ